MVNYDKWNGVGDAEEREEEAPDPNCPEAIAQRHPETAGVMLQQQEAMMRLVGWFTDAAPDLPDKEMAHIVRFCAVQDRVICPDFHKRHAAIADYLDEPGPEGSKWIPPLLALVKVCRHGERLTNAPGNSAEERAAGTRTLYLAMSALNTLGAVGVEGGMRKLVTTIADDPEGVLAKRYEAFEYARAFVTSRAGGGDGSEGEDAGADGDGDATASTEASVPTKEGEELQDDDEVYVPPLPPAKRLPQRLVPEDSTAGKLIRILFRHGGIIVLAFAVKHAYKRMYPAGMGQASQFSPGPELTAEFSI